MRNVGCFIYFTLCKLTLVFFQVTKFFFMVHLILVVVMIITIRLFYL